MKSLTPQIAADWVLDKWVALASAGIGDEHVPAAVQKSALDSIAKHLGMFDKKPPASGANRITHPDVISDVMGNAV